jgi:RsiW-degrading membrane proteinase PrsW (M82 family)
MVLFLAELLIGVILVVLLIGFLFINQDSLALFKDFVTQWGNSAKDDAALEQIMLPFLLQPGILVTILFYAAALVPLTEELFKPLGVWLLIKRPLTPAQGFAGGVLSGAGYAALESLISASAQGGETWLTLITARTGTGIIHVAASGLVGWGLASFWQNRRWGVLILRYFGAVCLHGVWNLFSILLAFTELQNYSPFLQKGVLPLVVASAPTSLTITAIGALILLVLTNRKVRKDESMMMPMQGASPAE